MAEVPRGLMQPIINGIVPVYNIPLQELPEHYNLVVEENKLIKDQLEAISFIYDLSRSQQAELQIGLKKSVNVDVDYVNGVKAVNDALTKENALLKMEITHLQNQKDEVTKAADENLKSAQQRIIELEKQNKMLKEMETIQEKAFETFENVTQEVIANQIQISFFDAFQRLKALQNGFFSQESKWKILINQLDETRLQKIELLKNAQIEEEKLPSGKDVL